MTDADILAARHHGAMLGLQHRSAEHLDDLAEIARLRGLVADLWRALEREALRELTP